MTTHIWQYAARASLCLVTVGACRDGGSASGPGDAAPEELVAVQTSNELLPGVDSAKVKEFLAALPATSHEYARKLFYRPVSGTGGVWFNLEGDAQLKALAMAALVGSGSSGPIHGLRESAGVMPAVSANRVDVWKRPVWIYLGEAGGKVSITVRNPGAPPGSTDAVFLPEDKATVEYLSAAIRSIGELRFHAANRGNLNSARGIEYRDGDKEADLPSTWRAYLLRKLGELSAAPLRVVPAHGKVRAIEIRAMGR